MLEHPKAKLYSHPEVQTGFTGSPLYWFTAQLAQLCGMNDTVRIYCGYRRRYIARNEKRTAQKLNPCIDD